MATSPKLNDEIKWTQPDELEFYSCHGKGGRYELIGVATGAGGKRGSDNVAVYKGSDGRLYYRSTEDYNERMYKLPKHYLCDRYYGGSHFVKNVDIPPYSEAARFYCVSVDSDIMAVGATREEAFEGWRTAVIVAKLLASAVVFD